MRMRHDNVRAAVFGSPLSYRCGAFVRSFFSLAATLPDVQASTERGGYSVEPTEIDRGAAAGQHQWRSQQRVFFRWSLGGIDCSSCKIPELKVIGRSSSFCSKEIRRFSHNR